MNRHVFRTCFCASVLTVLTACATVPPAEMDPADFVAASDKALAEPSPTRADRQLADLLDSGTLSPRQRVSVLLQRARLAQDSGIDKPRALADLDAAEGLLAAGDPGDLQGLVDTARETLKTSITAHRTRLEGLQTLPDWFDDQVALGALDQAVERYRRTGLGPTESQVNLLRDTGYICAGGTGGAGGEPVFRFDEPPAHVVDLVWCADAPDS